MAAMIVTISKIDASGINVKIKVNDGHPIPSQIVTDNIQSFRTWIQENGHIFIWVNSNNQEMSMLVPHASIGWVMSSMPINHQGDRFRINSPCSVIIEPETLPQ